MTDPITAALVAFAVSATGYALPSTAPTIETMSPAEIRAAVVEHRDLPQDARIGAFFQAGVIYEPELDMSKLLHQSFRVHELVHWLQWLNGQHMDPDPCATNIEAEAYAVQHAYLEAAGIADPLEWMGTDPWEYAKVTQCW